MFRSCLAVAAVLLAAQHSLAEEAPAPFPSQQPPRPSVSIAAPAPHTYFDTAIRPSSGLIKDGKCSQKQALLQQKLAELERLQREISELRAACGNAQQILLNIQVLEVNVTELQKRGVDIDCLTGPYKAQGVAPSRTPDRLKLQSMPAGDLEKVLQGLKQQTGVIKVLAEPTIVAIAGRPARFHSGGEVAVPAGGGAENRVEFINVGTEIDILADTLVDEKLRLQLGIRIREPIADPAGRSVALPSFHTRHLNTAIDPSFGESVVLSGLVEKRKTASKVREGKEVIEDVEYSTVFIITPERVPALAHVLGEPSPEICR